MAAAKLNQTQKREKRAEKRRKIDRITNWFMINLSWGILLIIVLLYMQNTLVINPGVLKIPAIILAAGAVALAALAKLKVLKNTTRVYDYAIFAAVVAVGCLFIGFYPQLRLVVGTGLDSRWWATWMPVTIILVYLAFAFVWTAIKVARVEKNK